MGKIEVPANVYWGAQTQRSLLHFNIGRDTMPPELMRAFGILKKACALVNQDLGKLPADKAKVIAQARELLDELTDRADEHVWRVEELVHRESARLALVEPLEQILCRLAWLVGHRRGGGGHLRIF